jgi:hypothetical protein
VHEIPKNNYKNDQHHQKDHKCLKEFKENAHKQLNEIRKTIKVINVPIKRNSAKC